jgi:excisionase family DNA binding protein
MKTESLLIQGMNLDTLGQILKPFEAKINAISEAVLKLKPQSEEAILTRHETADLLRVSLVTLNDWTNKGILTAYRLGNRVYYKRSEIDAAMTQIKKRG